MWERLQEKLQSKRPLQEAHWASTLQVPHRSEDFYAERKSGPPSEKRPRCGERHGSPLSLADTHGFAILVVVYEP